MNQAFFKIWIFIILIVFAVGGFFTWQHLKVTPKVKVLEVAVGVRHALTIKSDGTLWAWGHNYSGQLGLGDTIDRHSPVQVGTDTDWKQVVADRDWGYTLAIRTDGTLWGWGANSVGQLGLGDTTSRHSPVQVGTDTWKQVAAGDGYTLAIRTDGTLWTWGENWWGQLGLGDTIDRLVPAQVGTAANWKEVTASGSHTLAIRTDGTLWAWGSNAHGQLGLGDTIDRHSPTKIIW
jgi:alpha-tubulin suppressor-like RCC1 family protein